MFLADGGTNIKKLLEPVDEPLMPGLEWYGTAKDIGVHEMWQIQAERTELCKAYLDRWNECEGLDALLCELRRMLLFRSLTIQCQQRRMHRCSMTGSNTWDTLESLTS
jgi:hypothetical protein